MLSFDCVCCYFAITIAEKITQLIYKLSPGRKHGDEGILDYIVLSDFSAIYLAEKAMS